MSPPRVSRLHAFVWTATGIALLALFWLLGPMLAPFIIAAVLAYICTPAVTWLNAHRAPRALAVLLVIGALGLVLTALVLILVPMVYRQGSLLITRLPDIVDLLNANVLPALESRFGIDLQLDVAFLRRLLTEHWSSAQDLFPLMIDKIKSGGTAMIALVTNLMLIPLVMFYLLQEWPRLTAALEQIVPRPWLPATLRILGRVDSVLSEFLRGQLSVMLLLALYYSLGLWLAGLSFWLPVGVLTGLLIFVPFVGYGSGLVLAILAALLQAEGWPLLVGVGVVYGLGQLLEGFLLTPYLVGERIGLHPLAVIFALMAFGELFGFVGVLVALPVSAALLVGLREVREAWLASPIYLGNETTAQDAGAGQER